MVVNIRTCCISDDKAVKFPEVSLNTLFSLLPLPHFPHLLAPLLQMSNKRSNSFRRAILQGSRQLKGCSLRDEVGLGLSQRLVRHVAYETLPREVDRKWYFDSYTYCPPPWLILAITIAEVNSLGVSDHSVSLAVHCGGFDYLQQYGNMF